MECMQPVTCLLRKPFFRSLTHAQLNIHTISSVVDFVKRFFSPEILLAELRLLEPLYVV